MNINGVKVSFLDEVRFWNYVDIGPLNSCWNWKGAPTTDGYGRFRLRGKNITSNRLALAFDCGKYESDLLAIHSCDNPTCCNPKHLRWGTALDNSKDKYSRGRANNVKGSENGFSKLTEKDISVIRKLLNRRKTLKQIAKKFNVSFSAIWSISKGKNWKHVK